MFALGAVLYEALVGRPLFDDKVTPPARSPRPDVPDRVWQLVRNAVAWAPASRPATARELGLELGRAVAALGGPMTQAELAGWMAVRFARALSDLRRQNVEAIEASGWEEQTCSRKPPLRQVPPPIPHGKLTEELEVRDSEMWSGDVTFVDSSAPEPDVPWSSDNGEAVVGALPITASSWSRAATSIGLPATRRWIAPVIVGVAIAVTLASVSAGSGDDGEPEPATPIAAAPVEPAPEVARVAQERAVVAPARPPPAAAPTAATDAPAPVVIEVVASPPRSSRPMARPLPLRRRVPVTRAAGYFTVDSFPYATVFIDGRRAGVTPLWRVPLPAGRHVVRAVLADHRAQTFVVIIRPGVEASRRKLRWDR